MEHVLKMLDNYGVPKSQKWRSLFLFLRSLNDHSYLSITQKTQFQVLLLKTIKERDYSDEAYDNVMRSFENVLYTPLNEKLHAASDETSKLIIEFKDLVVQRRDNISDLENTTVDDIESGMDPLDLIPKLRSAFQAVIAEMKQDAHSLEKLSRTDNLTGLNNRRAFDQYMDYASNLALEENFPMSLAIVDIDHFKRFNDQHGHQVGDITLKAVADILIESAKSFNTEFLNRGAAARYMGESPKSDAELEITEKMQQSDYEFFPARYGGEEFCIIFPEVNLVHATQYCERIRQTIEGKSFSLKVPGEERTFDNIKVRVSIGVAQLNKSWQSSAAVGKLIKAADTALYEAKSTGRNRVRSAQ